jgi:hypothetical protein
MLDKARYKEAGIFVVIFVVSLVGWSFWFDKARDKVCDKEEGGPMAQRKSLYPLCPAKTVSSD